MAIDLSLEYSTVGKSGRTNITISRPSNTTDGDFLLAAIAINGNITITPPSGWSTLCVENNVDTSRSHLMICYKVASSEGSSWTWSHSFTDSAGFVKRFTGLDTENIEDTTRNVATVEYGSTITNTAITTITNDAAVLQIASHYYGSRSTTSHALTNRVAIADGLVLDGDLQAVAGSTGNKSIGLNDLDFSVGVLFAMRPLADVTGQPASKRLGGIPFASQNIRSQYRW